RDELKKSLNSEKLYLGFYPGVGCLSLYPAERWKVLAEAWKDERRFKSSYLMLEAQRLFFANIEPVTLDRVGRILIPAVFRERAGLEREASILGVGDKMEIWEPGRLKAREGKAMEMWQEALAKEEVSISHLASENLPENVFSFRLPQW
ncbi:MAG: hypothetical protein LBE31_09470, partial [Deltaproteobacteria bacterium]|nr:hypothetical protein [Deltaproteobacteria bacterium]